MKKLQDNGLVIILYTRNATPVSRKFHSCGIEFLEVESGDLTLKVAAKSALKDGVTYLYKYPPDYSKDGIVINPIVQKLQKVSFPVQVAPTGGYFFNKAIRPLGASKEVFVP